MGASGTPLGIGLAIDFAALDRDLGKVADHIENVGKDVSLKVGSLAGLAAKGGIDTDELQSQVALVGIQLSRGMASGVRTSSALMLGMGVHINSMLDRLSGSAITLFDRIDKAMKFPTIETQLSKTSILFGNVAKKGSVWVTDLDKAAGGGFGRLGKTAVRILMPLFDKLGKDIAKELAAGIEKVVPEIQKVGTEMAAALKAGMEQASAGMPKAVEAITREFKKLSQTIRKVMTDLLALQKTAEGGKEAYMFAKAYPEKKEKRIGLGPAREGLPSMPVPRGFGRTIEAREGMFEGPAVGPLARMPAYRPPVALAPAAGPGGLGMPGRMPAPPPVPPPAAASRYKLGGGFVQGIKDDIEKVKGWLTAAKTAVDNFYGAFKDTRAGYALGLLGMAAKSATTALGLVATGVVRFSAAVVSGTATVARWGLTAHTWFSSVGGVAGKTYSALFEGSNKWATALGLVPVWVAARGVTALWRAGSYLASMFVKTSVAVHGVGSAAVEAAPAVGLLGKALGYAAAIHISPASIPIGAYFLGAKAVQGVYRWFTKGKEASEGMGKSMSQNASQAGIFGKAVGAIAHPVETLGSAFKGLGVQMLAAFGVIGVVYKAVEFLKGGTRAASELNSTVAKTQTIFGSAFGPVEAQAKDLQKTYNILEKEQLDAAAGFGNLAINAGMSRVEAAKFSNEMVKLSANLASSEQHEGGFSEAASQIQAAIAGSTRSLREEAGQITAASITTRALTEGFDQSTTAATNQATILSRAKTVTERLWFVQDNLARTAGNASVQFRKAGGGLAIFAEKMGEILLPIAGAATTGFNTLLATVIDFVQTSGPSIASWVSSAVENVNTLIANIKTFGPVLVADMTWAWEEAKKGPLGFAAEAAEKVFNFVKDIPRMLGIAIRNMNTLWEIARLKVGEFVENAIRWFRTIPENFQLLEAWIGRNWWNMLVDMQMAITQAGGNLLSNAWKLGQAIWGALHGQPWEFVWTPILDGFKATAEALPEMIRPALLDVSDQTRALWAKIATDEAARALKPPPGAAKPLPEITPPRPVEAGGKEYKLAAAVEAGSKEAYSIVAKTQAGPGARDPMKEGVKVARDSHGELKEVNGNLKAMRDDMRRAAAFELAAK